MVYVCYRVFENGHRSRDDYRTLRATDYVSIWFSGFDSAFCSYARRSINAYKSSGSIHKNVASTPHARYGGANHLPHISILILIWTYLRTHYGRMPGRGGN